MDAIGRWDASALHCYSKLASHSVDAVAALGKGLEDLAYCKLGITEYLSLSYVYFILGAADKKQLFLYIYI